MIDYISQSGRDSRLSCVRGVLAFLVDVCILVYEYEN